MTIRAALAADLGILTAALDEPDADVLQSLHQLAVDAQAAVPTYLGLSVTIDSSDPPFTFTTFADGAADNVRTSLRMTLPAHVDDGRAAPSVALILYAETPGTFVDLTADLAWLTGRPSSDFALDQHLSLPAGSDAGTSLRAASVINQAIGVLIGRGYTPRQAHSKLDNQAAGTRTDRHTAAQVILDSLTAADPADAKRADQERDMGLNALSLFDEHVVPHENTSACGLKELNCASGQAKQTTLGNRPAVSASPAATRVADLSGQDLAGGTRQV